METARIADSKAEGTALPCEAWMHFAGGETSAERPGTTRMMFLAIFFADCKSTYGRDPFKNQLFQVRGGKGSRHEYWPCR